jgi:hypothetical protein
VASLSPSDHEITKALLQIANEAPKYRKPLLIPVYQEPNHVAIVLWVRFGTYHVLLGSDLETESDARVGWNAVVANVSPQICSARAQLYKVAHHGSDTGHHPGQWTHLLADHPVSVLTPFLQGDQHLPERSDIQRIRNLSSQLLIAGPIVSAPPNRHNKITDQFIADATRWIRPRKRELGHVRIRFSAARGGAESIQSVGATSSG